MRAFEPIHLWLLGAIAICAVALSVFCRYQRSSARSVRFCLAGAMGAVEIARYSHDRFEFPASLPLHLCDLNAWIAVVACITLAPAAVEFLYFLGLGGAGIALLTPDVPSSWHSFGVWRYFVEHGGIVIVASVLVFGRIAPLRHGAIWRAFGLASLYAALAGIFDAIFGANYFFLCNKPASASLLDWMGPWPFYIGWGVLLGLAIFWLLWQPVKPRRDSSGTELLGAQNVHRSLAE